MSSEQLPLNASIDFPEIIKYMLTNTSIFNPHIYRIFLHTGKSVIIFTQGCTPGNYFLEFMFDISPDVAQALLYDYEDLRTIKVKSFEVTIKVTYVLYSCLLYSEKHRVCNSQS